MKEIKNKSQVQASSVVNDDDDNTNAHEQRKVNVAPQPAQTQRRMTPEEAQMLAAMAQAQQQPQQTEMSPAAKSAQANRTLKTGLSLGLAGAGIYGMTSMIGGLHAASFGGVLSAGALALPSLSTMLFIGGGIAVGAVLVLGIIHSLRNGLLRKLLTKAKEKIQQRKELRKQKLALRQEMFQRAGLIKTVDPKLAQKQAKKLNKPVKNYNYALVNNKLLGGKGDSNVLCMTSPVMKKKLNGKTKSYRKLVPINLNNGDIKYHNKDVVISKFNQNTYKSLSLAETKNKFISLTANKNINITGPITQNQAKTPSPINKNVDKGFNFNKPKTKINFSRKER